MIPSSRLTSLDAFRGFVIAFMFFVNLSGNRDAFPAWFGHAGWNNGLHGQFMADYVFPWFLFIVGVAIPFSMHSGRGASKSTTHKLAAALRRGMVIYLLGILIWAAKSSPDSTVWRDGSLVAQRGIPISWRTFLHWDILPLIGFGYFLAAAACYSSWRGRLLLIAALLTAKAVILPDLAATSGLDRSLWMAERTDLDAAIRSWGWWGTLITQGLPAGASVLWGTLAGDLLRTSLTSERKSLFLILGGCMVAATGFIWAYWLPISKDFFTPTYVLVSCGTGSVVLGFFYHVLDGAAWSAMKARLLTGALLVAGSGGALFSGPGWFTSGQATGTAVILATGAVLFFLCAWRGGSNQERAVTLTAMGCNAIALYVASELLWTMVWMRWRVDCPGEIGPQTAFAALQTHFKFVIKPLLGALPAAGLGPWLATLTLISLYAGAARLMWKHRIFIKV